MLEKFSIDVISELCPEYANQISIAELHAFLDTWIEKNFTVDEEFDDVSFHIMHDNHTYTRLHSYDLDEIEMRAHIIAENSPLCSLCPATLLKNGKDVRKVGTMVHFQGKTNVEEVKKWRKSIEKDASLIKFLKKHYTK